jgi:WD40 repeat protein
MRKFIFIFIIIINFALSFSLEAQELVTKNNSYVVALFKCPAEYCQFFGIYSDGNVKIWDKSSKEIGKLEFKSDIYVYDSSSDTLAFSSGKEISYIKNFLSHLVEGDSIEVNTKIIPSRVLSLTFGVNDSLIAGTFDSSIFRWKFGFEEKIKQSKSETKSNKEKIIEKYIGPSEPVSAVVMHPVGDVFFSGDWAGALNGFKAYDSDRLKGEYSVNYLLSPFFTSVASRKGGSRSLSLDKTISEDSAAKLRQSRYEKLSLEPKTGELIFAATNRGVIEIWQVRGMKTVGLLENAHKGVINLIDASPNFLVSYGKDGLLNIFRVNKLSDEELKKQIDRSVTVKLNLVKQIELPEISALLVIDDSYAIVAQRNGQILKIEWNN